MDERGHEPSYQENLAGPIIQSIIGYVGIAYPIEQESRLYAIISVSQTWNGIQKVRTLRIIKNDTL